MLFASRAFAVPIFSIAFVIPVDIALVFLNKFFNDFSFRIFFFLFMYYRGVLCFWVQFLMLVSNCYSLHLKETLSLRYHVKGLCLMFERLILCLCCLFIIFGPKESPYISFKLLLTFLSLSIWLILFFIVSVSEGPERMDVLE